MMELVIKKRKLPMKSQEMQSSRFNWSGYVYINRARKKIANDMREIKLEEM